MDDNVISIDVEYPATKSSTFATGYRSKKPRACIKLTTEQSRERSIWVPTRVARQFMKEKPALPCASETIARSVDTLEVKTALVYLTEMLGRRDHSVGEAREKLINAGYHGAAIDHALERAQTLRFLDDTRFAAYFIEERKRRGWGQRKIELELKRKHVTCEDIPGYPETYFSQEDDYTRARELVSRKAIPETKPFEKLVRFLMGKGFSYSLSADVVKEYLASE